MVCMFVLCVLVGFVVGMVMVVIMFVFGVCVEIGE